MKSQKLTKVIVFLCITVGVVFWSAVAAYVVAPKGDQTPVLTAQTPTEQDPDLLAKAADLGIDVSNITLRYGELEEDYRALFEAVSTTTGVSYSVTVRPGMDTNQTYKSFAHEYYHYIWYTNPSTKNIAPVIRALYKYDTVMHERMQVYRDDGLTVDSDEFADELFAIYCTENTDTALTAEIATECAKWVNRGMTTVDR